MTMLLRIYTGIHSGHALQSVEPLNARQCSALSHLSVSDLCRLCVATDLASAANQRHTREFSRARQGGDFAAGQDACPSGRGNLLPLVGLRLLCAWLLYNGTFKQDYSPSIDLSLQLDLFFFVSCVQFDHNSPDRDGK